MIPDIQTIEGYECFCLTAIADIREAWMVSVGL